MVDIDDHQHTGLFIHEHFVELAEKAVAAEQTGHAVEIGPLFERLVRFAQIALHFVEPVGQADELEPLLRHMEAERDGDRPGYHE